MEHDAGNDFQLPRRATVSVGPDAELLDQQHAVALRVVGQHGGGVAALEQLALERPAPAAAEQAVAQPITVDPKITLKHGFLRQHVHITLAVEFGGYSSGQAHRRSRQVGLAW